MDLLSEDVQAEVEALQFTYGDELSIAVEGDACTLSTTAQPHTGGDASVQFVEARLQLHIGSTYPSSPPSIAVLDAKGMDDGRVRALLQHLEQEAGLACGELVLGHLIELAKDHLTACNVPEGACMMCLDDMESDASSSTDGDNTSGLAKLPCFHAFHTPCLVRWWAWRQAELYAQEQELTKRAGALAAAVLKENQLPPKEGGFYSTGCPICRQPFALDQLGPGVERLLRATLRQGIAAASSAEGLPAGVAEQDSAGRRLTAEQVAPFIELQQRHAAMLALQQQRGGLIEEVSYAMAAWEPLSSTDNASSSASSSGVAEGRASQAAGSSRGGGDGNERGGHRRSSSNNRQARHAGGRGEQQHGRRGQGARRAGSGEQLQAHNGPGRGQQQQQQQQRGHRPPERGQSEAS